MENEGILWDVKNMTVTQLDKGGNPVGEPLATKAFVQWPVVAEGVQYLYKNIPFSLYNEFQKVSKNAKDKYYSTGDATELLEMIEWYKGNSFHD